MADSDSPAEKRPEDVSDAIDRWREAMQKLDSSMAIRPSTASSDALQRLLKKYSGITDAKNTPNVTKALAGLRKEMETKRIERTSKGN